MYSTSKCIGELVIYKSRWTVKVTCDAIGTRIYTYKQSYTIQVLYVHLQLMYMYVHVHTIIHYTSTVAYTIQILYVHIQVHTCTYNHTLYKYSRIHYTNTVCTCTYTGTHMHIIIHYTSTVAYTVQILYVRIQVHTCTYNLTLNKYSRIHYTLYRYHRLGNFLCWKMSLLFLIDKNWSWNL